VRIEQPVDHNDDDYHRDDGSKSSARHWTSFSADAAAWNVKSERISDCFYRRLRKSVSMQKLTAMSGRTLEILMILIFCFFLCASSTWARVGESEAQVDHRYGKTAGKWDDYLGYKKLYHWHGFDVMVTFLDGVSQREMFNRSDNIPNPHDQKYLTKISDAGRNGIIFDNDSGTFTTKEFAEKYAAARNAAWAKSEQKQQ